MVLLNCITLYREALNTEKERLGAQDVILFKFNQNPSLFLTLIIFLLLPKANRVQESGSEPGSLSTSFNEKTLSVTTIQAAIMFPAQ